MRGAGHHPRRSERVRILTKLLDPIALLGVRAWTLAAATVAAILGGFFIRVISCFWLAIHVVITPSQLILWGRVSSTGTVGCFSFLLGSAVGMTHSHCGHGTAIVGVVYKWVWCIGRCLIESPLIVIRAVMIDKATRQGLTSELAASSPSDASSWPSFWPQQLCGLPHVSAVTKKLKSCVYIHCQHANKFTWGI